MYTKTFQDKGSTYWDRILWSDETKIELFGHNVVKMICQNRGETLLPKNTDPTLKHGKVKVKSPMAI